MVFQKVAIKLDPNNANRHDIISIQMTNICDISICRPLKLIFQSCLESGKFLIEWKKVNVVPIHKNGDKQMLKNYQPMLPTAGKIFERLLHDRI